MAFIGTFRTELKAALGASTAVGAYTLTAANIAVGYDDLGASSTFISAIGTANPKLVIMPAVLNGIDAQTRMRKWTVTAHLYFGFARETDNTLVDIEGLIEAMIDKWDVNTNFTGRGIPEDIRFGPPNFDTKASPVFGHYEIEIDVTSCG